MRPYRAPSSQRRRPPRPTIELILCTCKDCVANGQAFDSRSGKMVPGQLVGRGMYNTHNGRGGSLPRTLEDVNPRDRYVSLRSSRS